MESPCQDPTGCRLCALACYYSLLVVLSLTRRLRRIERTSKLDPLTGLESPATGWSERWPAALRSGLPLAVVYLDLDHLKWTNDTHWPRCRGSVHLHPRPGAQLIGPPWRGRKYFASHLAGDEFELLLRGTFLSDPRRRAETLLARLGRAASAPPSALLTPPKRGSSSPEPELVAWPKPPAGKLARGGRCAVVAGPDFADAVPGCAPSPPIPGDLALQSLRLARSAGGYHLPLEPLHS